MDILTASAASPADPVAAWSGIESEDASAAIAAPTCARVAPPAGAASMLNSRLPRKEHVGSYVGSPQTAVDAGGAFFARPGPAPQLALKEHLYALLAHGPLSLLLMLCGLAVSSHAGGGTKMITGSLSARCGVRTWCRRTRIPSGPHNMKNGPPQRRAVDDVSAERLRICWEAAAPVLFTALVLTHAAVAVWSDTAAGGHAAASLQAVAWVCMLPFYLGMVHFTRKRMLPTLMEAAHDLPGTAVIRQRVGAAVLQARVSALIVAVAANVGLVYYLVTTRLWPQDDVTFIARVCCMIVVYSMTAGVWYTQALVLRLTADILLERFLHVGVHRGARGVLDVDARARHDDSPAHMNLGRFGGSMSSIGSRHNEFRSSLTEGTRTCSDTDRDGAGHLANSFSNAAAMAPIQVSGSDSFESYCRSDEPVARAGFSSHPSRHLYGSDGAPDHSKYTMATISVTKVRSLAPLTAVPASSPATASAAKPGPGGALLPMSSTSSHFESSRQAPRVRQENSGRPATQVTVHEPSAGVILRPVQHVSAYPAVLPQAMHACNAPSECAAPSSRVSVELISPTRHTLNASSHQAAFPLRQHSEDISMQQLSIARSKGSACRDVRQLATLSASTSDNAAGASSTSARSPSTFPTFTPTLPAHSSALVEQGSSLHPQLAPAAPLTPLQLPGVPMDSHMIIGAHVVCDDAQAPFQVVSSGSLRLSASLDDMPVVYEPGGKVRSVHTDTEGCDSAENAYAGTRLGVHRRDSRAAARSLSETQMLALHRSDEDFEACCAHLRALRSALVGTSNALSISISLSLLLLLAMAVAFLLLAAYTAEPYLIVCSTICFTIGFLILLVGASVSRTTSGILLAVIHAQQPALQSAVLRNNAVMALLMASASQSDVLSVDRVPVKFSGVLMLASPIAAVLILVSTQLLLRSVRDV